MSSAELLTYNYENFEEFKRCVSHKGDLISFSVFFNYENSFFRSSYGDRTDYIDITNLVTMLQFNPNLTMHYETKINYILENNENCIFVVESNRCKAALNLFRNIFYVNETILTEMEQEDLNQLKLMIKKNIDIYEDGDFENLRNEVANKSFEFCLISHLVDIPNALDYTIKKREIRPSITYMVDISNMFSNPAFESIFRVEKLLCNLMEYDNINFCTRRKHEEIITVQLRLLFNEVRYYSYKSSDINIFEEKPFIEYNKNEIAQLFQCIRKEYFGHTKFLDDLEKKFQSYVVLSKIGRTKIFSALLCGSSGVGKTEIGRLLHKFFSPKDPPIKLNFGNYTNNGSLWSLIGSPKGYIGSQEGGELTNKIKNSKSKVILIDEFDRADPAIFNFFYELLEDGSYTDLSGHIIDLTGYIIIFTSNLNKKNYFNVITESLLSRIDMLVEFEEISRKAIDDFIVFTISGLLNDYKFYMNKLGEQVDEDYLNSIKEKLHSVRSSGETNLRKLKRTILNKFSEIVDVNINSSNDG